MQTKKVPVQEAIMLGYFDEAIKALVEASETMLKASKAMSFKILSGHYNHFKDKVDEGTLVKEDDIKQERAKLIKQLLMNIEKHKLEHVQVEIQPKNQNFNIIPDTEVKEERQLKILFLGIQPRGTRALRIDQESRDTQERIRMSKHRDMFTFKDVRAVRATDLLDYLVNEEPDIVHFSGHGYEEEGLVFENNDGKPHVIPPIVISNLFKMINKQFHVKCVILNACYSEETAKGIVEHVDYVIGVKDALPDKSAVEFSKGFYNTLGSNEEPDFEYAYDAGSMNIQLNGLPGAELLVLHKK